VTVAFSQAMLHRSVSLIEGAVREWNHGSGVTSAVLARCVLETVAVWSLALEDIQSAVQQGKLERADKTITQGFFGSKLKNNLGIPPIHVKPALESLDKRTAGIMETYDHLCEVSHPNGASILAISDWTDIRELQLDGGGRADELLSLILEAIRIDVAEDNLARSESISTALVTAQT
jgi:hypothetical protein